MITHDPRKQAIYQILGGIILIISSFLASSTFMASLMAILGLMALGVGIYRIATTKKSDNNEAPASHAPQEQAMQNSNNRI